MSIIIVLLSLYFLLLLLFIIVLILVFFFLKPDNISLTEIKPLVSVLLAVRNEEKNIISCLEALERMDYPKEKIEILIGDDQSEDKTVAVIENFIKGKSWFRLFEIKDNMGMAAAKGNVLAHLARKASGDFFFITDADVKVPATWIRGMLSACGTKTAIVSGSALISGDSLLSKCQCIDWITAFGMIHTAMRIGIPVTAVGNNMMVRKAAYNETGGFENIPFSVTEDFDLHEAVRKRRWKNINLLNHTILTVTQPIIGFGNILQQRKRWMSGAMRLHWLLVFLLSLQALFFPMLAAALFLSPLNAVFVWLAKMVFQNIYLFLVLQRVKQSKKVIWYFLLYEIYAATSSFALVIYYFLPLKTVWKGRKYA
jgi:cellulose synthase/poly-beta-1,6-N-acetylglucosamine synthase-like glycosyltransferase